MSESALFIGWGPAVRGREQKALQVFQEVVRFYTGLAQRGEISGFEPVALEPHGGDLAGFAVIRGSREQIDRLRGSDDFERLNARGGMVVEHLGIVKAYVGEGLQKLFEEFGKQAAELG
jgi:hypothetical protein